MKQRLSVLVDSKVLREFKEEVLRRYGRLYKAMGEAVEEALKEWVKKKQLPS